MSWAEEDVRLVPVEWLKAHEEIKPKNMEKLLEMTLRWDGFTKPLIADKATGTILDGHHRYAVAQRLELARIPVVCIDYLEDDSVELELWPASDLESITKQEVIDMALSSNLYPPKTRVIAYLTTCPRFTYRSSGCRCLRRVNLTRTNCRFPQTISIARCHGWVVWL